MPYHHGDLRRAMVAAARELLRQKPGEALSIRAAARRVAVSANAPYRHFADRDALLRAVAADGYRTAARRLGGGAGAARVAETWTRLVSEEPGLTDLMTRPIAGASDDPELQAAIGDWLGEVTRAIEGEAGSGDPARLLRRAIGCWAAVHGMVALREAGAFAAIDDWLLPTPVGLARRVTAE
jgi:AcrR family transcriptional regulator